MDYQFRNALNGFHKEDVVAYLEATNQAHQAKLQRLQNQLASADERYADLEEKETKYMEKISDLEAEISTIKIESGVKIANYEDNEQNNDDMESLQEEMEEYKRAAKECADSMASMQEEYEAQLEDLEWQLSSVKEKYDALGGDAGRGDESEELIALQSQVRQLKGDLAEAQAKGGGGGAGLDDTERFNEMQDEIYVLEDEVTALRQKLSEYEVKIALAGNEEAPASAAPAAGIDENQRITELQDEIYVLEDEVDALQLKLKEALEQGGEAAEAGDSEELEKARVEIKNAQTRLENMASTIDELETALDESELEVKELKTKLNSGEGVALAVPVMPVEVAAPTLDHDALDSAKLEISSLSIKLKEASDRAEEAELKLDSMSQTVADLEFTAQGYDARTQQLLSRLDNVERENQRLSSLQMEDKQEELQEKLKQVEDHLSALKTSEELLKTHLAEAKNTIKDLEESTVSADILAEKESLEAKLTETEEKLRVIDELEAKLKASQDQVESLTVVQGKLKEAEEKIVTLQGLEKEVETLEKEVETLKQTLEEQEKALESSAKVEKDNKSLRAQLDDATDELASYNKLRIQLKESQEELESLSKVKVQLREAREDLEASARVKAQLREAQDDLDGMSKLRAQLNEVTAELEISTKYKGQLAEAKEEMETLLNNLKATEEKLENITNEEIEKLTAALDEVELNYDDEKRHNATLITELDDLRVELTKRKNTEWSLQEELKKVQMSHDVLEHKVKRLEPAAKSYLSIKDRVETMEHEAQFRAQETINQAENEVFRVQQQVEQWLARVNSSYSSLCKELDENIVTVDQGLARASNALSQISTVIKTQDSAFSHLGRTISATSSAMNKNEETEVEQTWSTTSPLEWDAPPAPNWSTATIPNSASPSDWSTAPSPLPLEDIKQFDLYEELEALEEEEK